MSTGAASDPLVVHQHQPIVESPATPPGPEVVPESEPALTSGDFRKRFSIAEFARLHELGFIDEERECFELIDGDLIAMARMQAPHASAVNRLNRRFSHGLLDRVTVIIQNPLILRSEFDSVPMPDVTLARFREDGYLALHPGPEDIFLAIEVMETTHRYDRAVKLPRYAKSGIRETWLIDLPGAIIEVHRRPVDGVYTERLILHARDSVSPEAFPDLVLSVSEILGLPASEPES